MAASGGHHRSRPAPGDPRLIGSFGWAERPRPAEICPSPDCPRALPTDLYCVRHGRFLPFAGGRTGIGRLTAVLTVAGLLVCGFVLTAELDTWLPAFLSYALAGLGVVTLPLRRFELTVRATLVLWLISCGLAVAYRYTGAHGHGVIVSWLVVVAAVAFSLHAAHGSAVAASGRFVRDSADRSRRALAVTAKAFVVTATTAGLSVGPFPADVRRAALALALSTLAAGLVVAMCAGAVDGAARPLTREVGRWPSAALVVRATWAGLAGAIRLISRAIGLASFHLAYALVTMGIPAALIGFAAGLDVVSAEETSEYLTEGTPLALPKLALTAIAAAVALTAAWVVLAGQRRRRSLGSVRRAATATAPYAVRLIAAGGWIAGLPGTFGPGRIHVGWVTLAATALMIGAFFRARFSDCESARECQVVTHVRIPDMNGKSC